MRLDASVLILPALLPLHVYFIWFIHHARTGLGAGCGVVMAIYFNTVARGTDGVDLQRVLARAERVDAYLAARVKRGAPMVLLA